MDLFKDLGWLPRPPDDLRAKLKGALSGPPGELLIRLKELAGYGLDLDQCVKVGRKVLEINNRISLDESVFRLGVIGHGTLDYMPPVLAATGLRHDLSLHLVKGGYEQLLQEALSPKSELTAARPNAVLVALDARRLDIACNIGNPVEATEAVTRVISLVDAICAGISRNSGAICIVSNLVPPVESLFGSLDRLVPGTPRFVVDEINRQLAAKLVGTPHLLLDVAAIAETVGLDRWQDHAQWNLAKLSFNAEFLPLYAEHVVRILCAMRGKSRRVLVLDLDNTIWGGVVGDDGLEALALAQGDAAGEAYLNIQRWALHLRSRGIALAVCSKNTDTVAREVFQRHPDMLLREEHIAVFQANWNDKATNLRAIAAELSLGLGSLVFLDDNPVERGLVREMLPEVAVPELGTDPSSFLRTLVAGGYFESVGFSAEDRARAEFYRGNAKRAALKEEARDLTTYLASLNMEIHFAPFDREGRARIVQLINKSNQFNLTTRRYTESEVGAMEQAPGIFTLQVRLVDAFGDNGMISVLICRRQDENWLIDTWLMSCRVLGRGVERMVLRELLAQARARGIKGIIGIYIPSGRNTIVANHFKNLGFKKVDGGESGITRWHIMASTEIEAAPMAVHRSKLVS